MSIAHDYITRYSAVIILPTNVHRVENECVQGGCVGVERECVQGWRGRVCRVENECVQGGCAGVERECVQGWRGRVCRDEGFKGEGNIQVAYAHRSPAL